MLILSCTSAYVVPPPDSQHFFLSLMCTSQLVDWQVLVLILLIQLFTFRVTKSHWTMLQAIPAATRGVSSSYRQSDGITISVRNCMWWWKSNKKMRHCIPLVSGVHIFATHSLGRDYQIACPVLIWYWLWTWLIPLF